MEFIDYYKILELDKSASADQVKKAYRRLARKFHPDLHPNDKDANKAFQAINEANEVLSDPEKRKKYDQYGKDWQQAERFEQQAESQQAYSPHDFSGTDEGDFSGFFESMFGGAGRSRQTRFKGQDYRSELTLSLQDIMNSRQQTLNVNGKNIRITIAADVENGQVIKLKGYGAPGSNGGPAGDLYITFIVLPDPAFRRLGNDLYTNATIDLYTALLGGETIVETLQGKVKVPVKPETQQGTRVRLKGKGVPVYKKEGEAGDLYVTFEVRLPENLTDQQRALITELAKLK